MAHLCPTVVTRLFIFQDNRCLFMSYSLDLLVTLSPQMLLLQQKYDKIKTGSSEKRRTFMLIWATIWIVRYNEI